MPNNLNWPIESIRSDFPILHQMISGYPLAYLDNAATTQKPLCVIDAMNQYYQEDNANVHRGVHALSVRATEQYEEARQLIADYIGAPHSRECIFVRGTTEAINLVASAYLTERLKPDDEIVITHLEHHSNIVPWQRVCEITGAKLIVAPINQQGEVMIDEYAACLNARTKWVSMTYASNALGTINPVKQMIKMAHDVGAKVMIDGAQALPHLRINVQDLACDFFAFSGHKVFGPTGIGVLWGKTELLDSMSAYQTGGDMISRVTFSHTAYAPIPAKFEAGTPNISAAIGLGQAICYLKSLDWLALEAYEQLLLKHATNLLHATGDFKVIGESAHKVPVVSFVHPTIHAHDIGTILDSRSIAIRSGHHCAMPIMDFYKVPAMSRLSMAFYNTTEEIERSVEALQEAKAIFL